VVDVLIAGDGLAAETAYASLRSVRLNLCVFTTDDSLKQRAESDGVVEFDSLWNFSQTHPNGIIFLAGYKPIVGPEIYTNLRTLNLHASLLPAYRGMHSVVWALLNGEKKLGITIHEVDGLVDHGAILWQGSTPSLEKTSWQLMTELHEMAGKVIGQVVIDYDQKTLIPKPQDHNKATFCGRRRIQDCQLDWNWSCTYVECFFRALVKPYPLPYFIYKNKKWDIVRADIITRNYHEVPGHVLYRDEDSVWIKLGDGLLRLYEIADNGQVFAAPEIIKKVYCRL
jgi:methionyl-tRNA formyltransferase